MTAGTVVGDRARNVHEHAYVVLTHNHVVFPSDYELMRRGGVTAAFVVMSVDGRMYADEPVWRSSLKSDDGLLASTLVALDYAHWLEGRDGSNVLIVREPDDIDRAKQAGKVGLVLGSEGTRFLEGRLEVLRAVYRLGFRYCAPMWFYDCAAGAAQNNRRNEGLTDWGRMLIRECNNLGLLIDANHFSERSLYEGLELSTHPLIVSHSGARALNPEANQLLSDDAIKAIGEAGGVIGMMFQSFIMKPGYDPATLDHLVRQFAHCAELIGAEHLACGPDYLYNDPRLWGGNNPTGRSPGPITWAQGVDDPSKIPQLTEALLSAGFSDADVANILGGNAMRIFRAVRENAPKLPHGEYIGVGPDGAVGERTGGLIPV